MISGVPNISISTIEKIQDSKWRTVNTVQYFKEKYPNDELYLIIGEDSYKNFSTWFLQLLVSNLRPETPSLFRIPYKWYGGGFHSYTPSRIATNFQTDVW